MRTLCVALLSLSLAFAKLAVAQQDTTFSTFHQFTGYDGIYPSGHLILASDGNIYGTTEDGGTNNTGTVFEITLDGVLTTLYSFSAKDSSGHNSDGATPEAGVIQGSDGNFYGTAYEGGVYGHGTVFKITPAGILTTLHSFDPSSHNPDGGYPAIGLMQASDGNFYGATAATAYNDDLLYKITPDGVITILHVFSAIDDNNDNTDGAVPNDTVIQASDGNLYGTTLAGGASGNGVIYQVTLDGIFTTLYSFSALDMYDKNNSDGRAPYARLTQASNGYLYGTAAYGGADGHGTAYQISLSGVFTVLHNFTGSETGDSFPSDALILGNDGNFYSTTTGGDNSNGIVYRLTPSGELTVLYEFPGYQESNDYPGSGIVQTSDGSIYGAVQQVGGLDGYLYKLSLQPPFFTGEVSLGSGVYYLTFSSGNYFGYYSYLDDPSYIYHFDLGYEYVFDANDGNAGIYFYDFASSDFFYTSPNFPFPYLYDFNLNTVLYYYPDTSTPGHYSTNPRYFFDFATGTIITK